MIPAFVIWVVVNIRVPFLGTLNNRCRIIIRTQKETPILTTTHMILRTGSLRARLGNEELIAGRVHYHGCLLQTKRVWPPLPKGL